jgi:hypothetical protein
MGASSRAFRISYHGGTGNDVVLTTLVPGVQFSAISQQPWGQIQLNATGAVSGLSYTLQAATNLAPSITWSNIGSAAADASGMVSFLDTNTALFQSRFYRAVSP